MVKSVGDLVIQAIANENEALYEGEIIQILNVSWFVVRKTLTRLIMDGLIKELKGQEGQKKYRLC